MAGESRCYAVVSAPEASRVPYPYVYVNSDGTVRELHPNERAYLETPFAPGDGGRPYTKQGYDAEDGWGDIAGFCRWREIPDDLCVYPAPAEDPTPPVTGEYWAELAKRPVRPNARKKLLSSEQEWLTTPDPTRLVRYALRRCKDRLSDRKLRLIQVALARRLWVELSDDRSRRAVETAARFAEDQGTAEEVVAAWRASGRARQELHDPRRESPDPAARAARAAEWTVCFPKKPPRKNLLGMLEEIKGPRGALLPRAEQADVIRDVLGNPFRPVTIPPACLSPTVRSLAEGIVHMSAFDRMPILADALQDAGCADELILGHCRGPGPHVRGCWVVDLVLGKA